MALIRTPHAAIIVWNYDDRLSAKGVTAKTFDWVNEVIISTVSLVSISTNKTKSSPAGTFNFALAPTRNWVSVLTPGSWCAIMMSNEPLVEASFKKANAKQVKMLGRIETVRVNVTVGDDGARSTSYVVSGQDWGSIFNNAIYVDSLIQDKSDSPRTVANALYQQLIANCFSANGDLLYCAVPTNLNTFLSIIGNRVNLPGAPEIPLDRLAKATHDMSLPSEVSTFFQFTDGAGKKTTRTQFTELLKLIWGPLESEDVYNNNDPNQTGTATLNPFDMVGQHSLWSILQENSNYAINEMFSEMSWPLEDNGPVLLLYNRIKPFSYTKVPASDKVDTNMRSMFQLIASHKLDDEAVISANAGTNWADKYNFVEIKPDINELGVLGTLLKMKCQAYQGVGNSSDVFDREGFRPIMFSIKQLPFSVKNPTTDPIQASKLEQWVHLAKEWYFDSHKLLNGQVVLQGSSEYIPVGDNIMFDAELIGVTHNYNSASVGKEKIFVLGHVESVQNSFTVDTDGTRSFHTTIQFVRGIIVDKNKGLIGEGTIDTLARDLMGSDSYNSRTTYTTQSDPKE